MSAASLGALQLLGQLLDAALDVALEMVRSLVLGDDAEHLPQRFQALSGVARLAERGLCRSVLRREVGGHGPLACPGGGAAQVWAWSRQYRMRSRSPGESP